MWVSKYTEIEEQLICANCGKKSGGYYETLHLPEDEPYKGNSRVVSQKLLTGVLTNGTTIMPRQNSRKVRVWRLNRGTYRGFNYGNFCSNPCAVSFANAAVNAGYHRSSNTQSSSSI